VLHTSCRTHAHTNIHILMYMSTHSCTAAHTHACASNTHTYTNTHALACTHARARMHTSHSSLHCMYSSARACAHDMHTHTHIHTHALTCARNFEPDMLFGVLFPWGFMRRMCTNWLQNNDGKQVLFHFWKG
jgi:hypothetical protein